MKISSDFANFLNLFDASVCDTNSLSLLVFSHVFSFDVKHSSKRVLNYRRIYNILIKAETSVVIFCPLLLFLRVVKLPSIFSYFISMILFVHNVIYFGKISQLIKSLKMNFTTMNDNNIQLNYLEHEHVLYFYSQAGRKNLIGNEGKNQ